MKKQEIVEGLLYYKGRQNAFVSAEPYNSQVKQWRFPVVLCGRYHLQEGARLKFEHSRESGRYNLLSVNGRTVSDSGVEYRKQRYKEMIVINPEERFELGESKDNSLRLIDLAAPIAKGSRALVISPPRAGKTVLLEKLAVYFSEQRSLRTILLLIDERPEEVTHFKRMTGLPVYSSTLDSQSGSHTRIASLIQKNLKQEMEAGNDTVVLIDSITRLGRAHNRTDRSSGSRVLSGGIGAGALEIPRQLFGMARNIENGGSCTIIATVLRDTGSRMDEYIYQEFKGTGNCEIVLSRLIAEQRVYPAVDLKQSGTRREELLRSGSEWEAISNLHQKLSGSDQLSSIKKLQKAISETGGNRELLERISAKL